MWEVIPAEPLVYFFPHLVLLASPLFSYVFYFQPLLVHKWQYEHNKALKIIFHKNCAVPPPPTICKSTALICDARLEDCLHERRPAETQLDNNTVILLIIHNPGS